MKSRFLAAILVTVGLVIPGCVPKSNDCGLPEVFCVGLVTSVGRHDDHSYNQAAWEGLQQAKASGAADWVAFIETVDSRDYEENIGVFAEAGYDVIVTVGSAMREATQVMAQEYPTPYFIGLDQEQLADQDPIPNLVGLVFAEDQIGYLAGALAAMLSETGQIGAVCASDELPFIKRYGDGYRAGAAATNPDVVVTVVYHNDVSLEQSFSDPQWGAAMANALIDAQVDIVFGVGGTTGSEALAASAMRSVHIIGADIDQYYALPVAAPYLYTSFVKLITPGIADLISAAKDGQSGIAPFPSGNYLGQVGLAPYHELSQSIPENVKLRIEELYQALLSGEIQTGVSIPPP